MENNESKELGFRELFSIVWKKLYVIVIAIVVAALIGGITGYSANKNVDVYGTTAKFKISVYSKDGETVSTDLNYIYKESHLAMILDELSSDRFIADNVIAEIENMPVIDENDPDYDENALHAYLEFLQSAVTYSYDYNKNPNAISVSVAVKQNKALAEAILKQLKVSVPEYISAHMIKPENDTLTDSNGAIIGVREYETFCEEMTISRVHLLNEGQSQSSSKKSAILFGFAAAVIATIAVVVADTSNFHPLRKKKTENQEA